MVLTPSGNQMTTIRFLPPIAGLYLVIASFSGATSNTDSNSFVILSNETLFSQLVRSNGQASLRIFNETLSLTEQDTLEFIVGSQMSGLYFATLLDVQIVPLLSPIQRAVFPPYPTYPGKW